MKIIILLTMLCCFMANAVETIYLNDIKVSYKKRIQLADPDVLSIYLNKDKPQPSYQYNITTDQMVDANNYNGILTIMFKIRNTDQLLLLNQETGAVIDNFWAYFSNTSPDGRFIVYKKWRRRNETSIYGVPAGITLIYDVTKTPSENRTLGNQKHLQIRPPSLSNYSKHAGIPVYPLGDYNQPEYGWVADFLASSSVYGEYFWYQDNAFIFATPPKKNMTKLINAVYNNKQNKFEVKIHKVTTKDFPKSKSENKSKNNEQIAIKRIEKTAEHLKLFTKDAIIRLDNLNQLEQIE